MLHGFAEFLGRTCARRRGDCIGMTIAGIFFVRASLGGGMTVDEGAVFGLVGGTLALCGLAATSAALLYRRA